MAHGTRRRTAMLLALGTVAAVAVLGTGTTSASAATTATVPCTTRTVSAKFLKIDGDTDGYFTAPGGTFEAGATPWSLRSASTVAGNEPYFINGSGNSRSLKVDSGGSATSQIFCNQYGERSIRFFYRGTRGARIHLHIDATNSSSNAVSTLDWEMTVPSTGGWAVAKGINTPNLYLDGIQNLQIKFTALGGSVWVDDVEIDPWKSL